MYLRTPRKYTYLVSAHSIHGTIVFIYLHSTFIHIKKPSKDFALIFQINKKLNNLIVVIQSSAYLSQILSIYDELTLPLTIHTCNSIPTIINFILALFCFYMGSKHLYQFWFQFYNSSSFTSTVLKYYM